MRKNNSVILRDWSDIQRELEDVDDWKKNVLVDNMRQFFMLLMGALIMFMQCGFAFLEAGTVRSKNVVNILIKNALDFFCGAVVYWVVGYAFAYGSKKDGNVADLIIGSKYFLAIGLDEKDIAHWFFQFVFAATAATIVSGAVAERTQFGSYLIYSIYITGFVYPIASHWAWTNEGWLQSTFEEVKYVDFAGAGVVHCTGGVAALMGAYFIGPRKGKFSEDGSKEYHIQGHSVPLASLGGFILFFGFLAFNGGSKMQIITEKNDSIMAALAMFNTVIAGAGGALTALACKYTRAMIRDDPPVWSLITCINGALAGMVATCAGADKTNPGATFALGIFAGFTMWWMSDWVKNKRIDDPLGTDYISK